MLLLSLHLLCTFFSALKDKLYLRAWTGGVVFPLPPIRRWRANRTPPGEIIGRCTRVQPRGQARSTIQSRGVRRVRTRRPRNGYYGIVNSLPGVLSPGVHELGMVSWWVWFPLYARVEPSRRDFLGVGVRYATLDSLVMCTCFRDDYSNC